MPNGNLLEYIKEHPSADPVVLVGDRLVFFYVKLIFVASCPMLQGGSSTSTRVMWYIKQSKEYVLPKSVGSPWC